MDNNLVIYVCLISEMCTVTLRCSEVGPIPDVPGLAAHKCVGTYTSVITIDSVETHSALYF